MAIYCGKDMPKEVGRTTMDVEVKNWLKDGPVLGSHEPTAARPTTGTIYRGFEFPI
ncbi:MAG TPA: hypothetical protein VIH88_11485 [Candidatus Acidoferrales bacterium]|jgi:hypothetical protein